MPASGAGDRRSGSRRTRRAGRGRRLASARDPGFGERAVVDDAPCRCAPRSGRRRAACRTRARSTAGTSPTRPTSSATGPRPVGAGQRGGAVQAILLLTVAPNQSSHAERHRRRAARPSPRARAVVHRGADQQPAEPAQRRLQDHGRPDMDPGGEHRLAVAEPEVDPEFVASQLGLSAACGSGRGRSRRRSAREPAPVATEPAPAAPPGGAAPAHAPAALRRSRAAGSRPR